MYVNQINAFVVHVLTVVIRLQMIANVQLMLHVQVVGARKVLIQVAMVGASPKGD